MAANNGQQDFDALLGLIHGLPCWHVGTGGADGTTFSLALGDKIPRQHPLKNPSQAEEFRQNQGEASLLVWCAWRLDDPDEPVVSWDNDEDAVAAGLNRLVGATIQSATVSAPAWDLIVHFSNDLVLRIFCDHLSPDPSFDRNWDLHYREKILAVGPGPHWRIEHSSELTVPSDK
jgi:hypothetical protein